MKLLTAVTPILAGTALLSAPASAHHSLSRYDLAQEILIKGKVARLDWMNPHMYLIVETEGPDGQPALVEGEGQAITQALVAGLNREALQPGRPVVMRANPNRGGWGKQVRVLDVTTEDGEIHPFYAANRQTLSLTPAESIEGHWAPSLQAATAAFGAIERWPVTAAGRAAQATLAVDGLCYLEPTPFLAVLNELRTIEIGDDEIVMRFDNSGDLAVRVIQLDAEHPADVQPSRFGHAIARWEGDTLVIDTVAFEVNPSGIAVSVPSSPGKHTVERLTLAEDHSRLRYETTVEDPVYLERPAELTMQWDHRPDLEFSQNTGACDPEVARRYLELAPN